MTRTEETSVTQNTGMTQRGCFGVYWISEAEVRVVKKRIVWRSSVVIGLVLLAVAVSATASAFSTSYGRYKLGETILFKIEDQQRCGWGCCCNCCQPACTQTQVLGWRIADSSGNIVYSMVYDVAVLASTWQGSWSQVDSVGAAVAAGSFTLYVDTSAGTLSRCLYLYDPCCGCCWGWSRCGCGQKTTITNCCCSTSLVFVQQSTSCCFSLFRWPCCP